MKAFLKYLVIYFRPNEMVADIFQRSVVMSTYTVAFAVCDFQYQESISPNGHIVSSCSFKLKKTFSKYQTHTLAFFFIPADNIKLYFSV